MLLFLFHGAYTRSAKWRQPVNRIETLQYLEPGRNCFVAYLKIFPNRIDRERRSDQLGEPQHQELEVSKILDSFQARDFFPNQEIPVFTRPAAGFGFRT